MGVVDVSDDRVLHFEEGIPGFPGSKRFALVNVAEDSAFQLLQSLDEPGVSMIVTVPWLFFPDYAPELSELERGSLGAAPAPQALRLGRLRRVVISSARRSLSR